MKKVLLTGASGFIGTFLLRYLREANIEVIGISRQKRLSTDPGMKWIEADISDESSLTRLELMASLQDIDTVIHAAALYDLEATHEHAYKQNVIGTVNVIHLVRQLPPDTHFVHLSSVGIAGNSRHRFKENDFNVGQTFSDVYGSTKYAAEQIVRAAVDLKKRTVLRLGIVIGSSEDGTMLKLDGVYHVQKAIQQLLPFRRFLNTIRYVPFPFHEHSRLYLVPVDFAAKSILKLIDRRPPDVSLKTFHIIGGTQGVSVRQVLSEIFTHYGFNLELIAVPKAIVPCKLLEVLRVPVDTVSYMTHEWTFDSDETQKYLNFRFPRYRTFVGQLLSYADAHLLHEKRKKA